MSLEQILVDHKLDCMLVICDVSGSSPLNTDHRVRYGTGMQLTHDAYTALLTHTNASATLDAIYKHLQSTAPAKSTGATSPAIPLNELQTPFGLYDWELGLHAPMLMMDKLTNSQRYDKALEIARFVFNPMASGEKDPSLLRVWKWDPFQEISA